MQLALLWSRLKCPIFQVELTLVLNKIDRLILELRLTPQQAYERMRAIITQVNMIISAFQSEQYMSEADAVLGLQDAAAARCPIYTSLVSALTVFFNILFDRLVKARHISALRVFWIQQENHCWSLGIALTAC